MNVLANVSSSDARLPVVYEAAKVALANCASVDECVDWADKAAALASYARQANDDTLLKHAQRIQGRAVRRCGELLKQFDGRGRPPENKGVSPPNFSQREAAKQAGLSADQQKQAGRVASIPLADFEAAIEDDQTPTVTALAEMGRKRRAKPTPSAPVAPVAVEPGFRDATQALATVSEFAAFCRSKDPVVVAGGVDPREVTDAMADVDIIDRWLDRFISNLRNPA